MKTRIALLCALALLSAASAATAAPKAKIDGTITATAPLLAPPTVTIQGKSGSVTLNVTAATQIKPKPGPGGP